MPTLRFLLTCCFWFADYDKEMEITFWNATKDAKSKELLQAYLDRYPSDIAGITPDAFQFGLQGAHEFVPIGSIIGWLCGWGDLRSAGFLARRRAFRRRLDTCDAPTALISLMRTTLYGTNSVLLAEHGL
jgi:hypothetical protein